MGRFRLGVVLVALSLPGAVASAQSSSLGGRVADLQGNAIADAEVSLRDLPSAPPSMPGMPGMRMPASQPRTTRSGRDGTFALDQVPAG